MTLFLNIIGIVGFVCLIIAMFSSLWGLAGISLVGICIAGFLYRAGTETGGRP